MSSFTPVNAPPPPPAHHILPSEHAEPTDFSTEHYYLQRTHLHNWLFASPPSHRSCLLLCTLHPITVLEGLKSLREITSHLTNLELKLWNKYMSMLTQNEYAKYGRYAVLTYYTPPRGDLEGLRAEELVGLLEREVRRYDVVVDRVKAWKGRVDERLNPRGRV